VRENVFIGCLFLNNRDGQPVEHILKINQNKRRLKMGKVKSASQEDLDKGEVITVSMEDGLAFIIGKEDLTSSFDKMLLSIFESFDSSDNKKVDITDINIEECEVGKRLSFKIKIRNLKGDKIGDFIQLKTGSRVREIKIYDPL